LEGIFGIFLRYLKKKKNKTKGERRFSARVVEIVVGKGDDNVDQIMGGGVGKQL